MEIKFKKALKFKEKEFETIDDLLGDNDFNDAVLKFQRKVLKDIENNFKDDAVRIIVASLMSESILIALKMAALKEIKNSLMV